MRRVALVLALMAAAAAVGGCGGSSASQDVVTVTVATSTGADTAAAAATSAAAATTDVEAAEYDWLVAFDDMTDEIDAALDVLKGLDVDAVLSGDQDTAAGIFGAVETITSCGDRLDALGESPTADTSNLAGLYRKGCERLSRGAQGMADAIDEFQAAGEWNTKALTLIERATREISRAAPFIQAAYDKLSELLA